MNEIQETMVAEKVNPRALHIGRFLTFNGVLFIGLGVYLIFQTGSWQAYTLLIAALIVTIGSGIGTNNISNDQESSGGWILFAANLIGPAIPSLALTRMGLISVPYMLISSFLIIRYLIPSRRRNFSAIISILTILSVIAIEVINPSWTLDSQLVLNIGFIFILLSLLLGISAIFFGPVWNRLHIREKLIGSVSILSIILIGVLTANSIRNLFQQAETEELKQLTAIYDGYNTYVASLEDTAAALALSLADRQDVLNLLQARDRQGLLDLLTPLFDSLKKDYEIVHMYIEDPDGTVFVRIHNPESYGDDITYRRTATAALQAQQPVAGVEIGPGRLGVRGVAPLFDDTKFVGLTEVGIDYDQAFINDLKENTNVDYTIWIAQEAAAPAGLQPPENFLDAPIPELFFYASTNQTILLPIPEEAYSRVFETATVETHYVSDGSEELVVLIAPLLGYGGRTIGVFEIISSRAQTLANIQNDLLNSVGVAAVVSIIGFASLLLLSQILVLRPIDKLTTTSRRQLAGDLAIRVPSLGHDEFGELGSTLNALTESLQESVQDLEKRVEERTEELEKAAQQIQHRATQFESIAEVSHIISTIQSLDELLPQITQMISQHFGFYHTGIFLLDETNEYAVLRAANSEGGLKMLERGHRLGVGQTGIVGFVTSTGDPRIVLDTGADAVYFDNPDLPDTRSEMALPLKGGDKLIGALDVQSTEANAFSQEDINILSILADQVSIAIENVRLYEETQEALAQTETAYRQSTIQSWSDIQRIAPVVGYRFDGNKPEPLTQISESEHFEEQQDIFSVPVKLRGTSIGRLRIKPRSDGHQWSEDEIAIIRATADRVALATENARLVAESQRRASKEQAIGDISTKISAASINIRSVLQTAVEELGRALPGSDVVIQLTDKNQTGGAK